MSSRQVGTEAEKAVGNILLRQGWRVIGTNFQTRNGEIDLIAEEGQALVFVEVKSALRPSPLLAGKVNAIKQKRLILAASRYLQEIDTTHYNEIRFDVITVVKNNLGNWSINHIRNAFEVEGEL